MQPRIQEQRRWARTALEDPENLSLCYTDSSGKLQLTQVSICDVSGGGLGVISPLALPVGAYISTGGSANGASAAISARRATVASCRPLTKGTFGIGLAYQQLDPDAKSRRIEGLGIWHSAVHGQSLYVNQPMCEMLEIVGWEDLGGKTYESFVGAQSGPVRKEPSHVQATLVGCRGHERSMLVYEEPLFTCHGQPQSLFRTFIDLTGIEQRMLPSVRPRDGRRKIARPGSHRSARYQCAMSRF
jgi:hypothetical protein